MAATLTHDAADPIDRLLNWTCGEVLRVGAACSGGEMDSYRDGAVSRRTMRRLAGAGLVSRDGGLEPDRLQHALSDTVPAVADLNPDEFVSWWVAECVAGLDHRAARRAGTAWEDQPEPAPWPADLEEWLARMVHAEKAAYVIALAVHQFDGGPAPEHPGAPWALEARARFERRYGSGVW